MILDPRLRTPLDAKVFNETNREPVIVVTSQHTIDAFPGKRDALVKRGAVVITASSNSKNNSILTKYLIYVRLSGFEGGC